MATTMGMRELRIIWIALICAVVAYTGVALWLVSSGTMGPATLSPDIVSVLAAAVMVYMGAGLFARRALIARIPSDAPPEGRMARYATASIVGQALMESGGLLVVSLGLLAGSSTWVLAGGGAAAAMMSFARPSPEEAGLSEQD